MMMNRADLQIITSSTSSHHHIMKKVGIIGSGTMGIGIAQVAATAHCEVFLYDAKLLTNRKISKKFKNHIK